MERYDSYIGQVKCCSKNGVYIELSNGTMVFAYYGGIAIGTKVLCSVLKEATEYRLAKVSVDSVLEDIQAA